MTSAYTSWSVRTYPSDHCAVTYGGDGTQLGSSRDLSFLGVTTYRINIKLSQSGGVRLYLKTDS